jgi:hypothetical protein
MILRLLSGDVISRSTSSAKKSARPRVVKEFSPGVGVDFPTRSPSFRKTPLIRTFDLMSTACNRPSNPHEWLARRRSETPVHRKDDTYPTTNRINSELSAEPRWGGRRDLNPQQPEPQSGALPLSYDHHSDTGKEISSSSSSAKEFFAGNRSTENNCNNGPINYARTLI